MSGPGCDQPGLTKNIVKNKVASSIAHLYERPRTWLEGFYGSGWGTSSEEVADAIFANFAMGQNLLSLHGLYYSTHGSMWEWAAPDNHWRQPYWANMGDFLKCSERLSYVLSQGHHRCDIAIVYPVAPTEARLKGEKSTKTAFTLAEDLYPSGMDFDFMDFESLTRCNIVNKELNVSGEKYKILILPSLSAVRYSTIEKALEFYRSGGIVLAVGALPEASERIGGNDEQLQAMIREMFGTTFSEKHDTTVVYSQKSKSGGTGLFISNPLEAKKIIGNLIQSDFKVLSGEPVPGILHRKVGNRDLYFVYGLPKGTSCLFRATGKAELWNPWDGSTKSLKVSSTSELGTTIKLPLEKSEPQLIVFSPGKPEIEKPASSSSDKTSTMTIDCNWEFELKPTLDNRFGDYRLPAFDGKLGVEVWKMKFAEEKNASQGQNPQSDESQWTNATVGYGPQFWKLGPLPNTLDSAEVEAKLSSLQQINPEEPVELNGKKYYWKPYEFSWRWGLKDDAGHQGYHGLKGFINDENISLGSIDRPWNGSPIYPLKPEPEGTVYYLWSAVSSPKNMQSKIIQSGLVPQQIYVNHKRIEKGKDLVELNEGYNPVLLKYNNIGRGVLVFLSHLTDSKWKQTVPLATNWYLNPAVLSYNFKPDVKTQFGWYRFNSPPGTRAIYVTTKAKPEVWVVDKQYSCEPGKLEAGRIADTNLRTWKVTLPENLQESASVAMKMEQLPGFYGGSALPEPVVFECGIGIIRLGDLQENESLKSYSGGMWYRKSIAITAEQSKATQIIIDLGKVVASAEVFVNGKPIGAKVSSPWTFDLSGKLKTGENRIEILVYNTLGNHYLNTPSQYIGRTNSGLIGPVKIEFR
jgi:hypothetical protein